MSGPENNIPLPLYRSLDTVRAAVIVGVAGDQVQVDYPRDGDDVPVLKTVNGPAEIGQVYVEPGGVMSRDEFARRYSPSSNDAPRLPQPIIAAMARVGYEAARANQRGKGPGWDQVDDITRQATTALAKLYLDNPYATQAEAHEHWAANMQQAEPVPVEASQPWSKVAPDRKISADVFRAAVLAQK